jgi:pyrroloquinoline quinone biosynthesis protein B
LLINTSPDLPAQLLRTQKLHPRGGTRGSPIKAVLLTGAEIDQVTGLLSLREREPFILCATAATLAVIEDAALLRQRFRNSRHDQ